MLAYDKCHVIKTLNLFLNDFNMSFQHQSCALIGGNGDEGRSKLLLINLIKNIQESLITFLKSKGEGFVDDVTTAYYFCHSGIYGH